MRHLLLLGLLLLESSAVAQDRVRARITPLPRQAEAPASNPTSKAKVELGKQLFFDPRLSGSNKTSCASCHIPEKAFTDGRTVAQAPDGEPLARNTQSCLNVGFLKTLFWDGRAASLEAQAVIPIQAKQEMNQDLKDLEAELSQIPGYMRAFRAVFGTKPTGGTVAQALAAFQRTLIPDPSPFDRYLGGEKSALSAAAVQGWELFRGEAGCIDCHHGPLLSDGKYYRLGVSYKDLGRAKITNKREDRYRFRTPTLRNVADTGPYMHDGSMRTLSDVVTFYYRGIPETDHDGLVPDLTALTGQSFSDIDLLVAFLKSLSGKLPVVTPPKLP